MTETAETQDRWQMLEDPPAGTAETAALYSWSLNFEHGKGPFPVFLDLIGYSYEEFGQPIAEPGLHFGTRDLQYLADALTEYTSDPNTVLDFVHCLIAAEMSE